MNRFKSASKYSIPFTFLAALAVGCGQPSDQDVSEFEIASDDAPLIGGTNTTARPEVGQIFINTSGFNFSCTATLISSRYFVTAAHCLGYRARAVGGTFTITRNPVPAPPTAPTVTFNIDATYALDGNPTNAVVTQNPCPPAPAPCTTMSNNGLGAYDIAVGRLTTDVPAATATPVRISDRVPGAGDAVTEFGYGCTSKNPNAGGGSKQSLSYTWPPVDRICSGDSGGPVFLANGTIAAVASGNQQASNTTDMMGLPPRVKGQIEALIRSLEDGTREALEPSTDRIGSDLPGMPVAAASATACRTLCSGRPDCRAFSFTGTSCFMKSAVPSATTNASVTSGVMQRGLEPSLDRVGGDLTSIAGSNAAACRTACSARTDCAAFTFATGTNTCFLKSFAPSITPNAGAVSGLPVSKGVYNLPGGDMPNGQISGISVDVCQDRCTTTAGCVGYTYTLNNSTCFLKSSLAAPTANSNCLSGVKRGGLEPSTDRPGNDFPNMPILAASAAGCQTTCFQRSDCAAFSFVTSGSLCYLKTGMGTPTTVNGVTSGIRKGIEVNVNRGGSDFLSVNLTNPVPEDCQARCEMNGSCRSWTLVTKTTGQTTNTCFLKDGIPAPTTGYGMYSGVRRGWLY